MVKITRDILDDIIEGKEVTQYVSPSKKKKTKKIKHKKSNFNERMKQMGAKKENKESSANKIVQRKKTTYRKPDLHVQHDTSLQQLNDIQEKLKKMKKDE